LELDFLFFGGAALLMAGSLSLAMGQVNCDTFPAGPARTDCYIGLSRINRQKSEISAGVAQEQAETATYRNVTISAPTRSGVVRRLLGKRNATTLTGK
jgi:hypothetical protein